MRLDPIEVELLSTLLDDLAGVYDEVDQGISGAVRERLFPAANRDDPAIAAEYRDLTEEGLLHQRTDRLGQCRADLAANHGELELDDEAADRWLTVTNDLRLSIGTVIGITAEGDGDIDPTDPLLQAKLTYHWLTGLQDSLVQAAMG
jgi:Domain of unknown function (DUF2017)